jgi:hypothetical protein
LRASIATGISSSRYTGVKMRNQQLRRNPELAQQPLRPLIGTKSFNMPNITESDYIEFVDLTRTFTSCSAPASLGALDVLRFAALLKRI